MWGSAEPSPSRYALEVDPTSPFDFEKYDAFVKPYPDRVIFSIGPDELDAAVIALQVIREVAEALGDVATGMMEPRRHEGRIYGAIAATSPERAFQETLRVLDDMGIAVQVSREVPST